MTEVLTSAWDAIADDLAEYPVATERVRYAVGIKPLLELPKSARILEAGCGSGRLLRTLDALGYERLVGLEISRERLEHIRRRGPRTAELVSSPDIPFDADSFDAVVSTGVIEHVEDAPSWLGQLAQVVRPGGVVSVTSDTYMWRWLQRLGLYRTVQPIDQAIWPATLIRWGRRAGLRLAACGGFYNTPDQRYYFIKQLARLRPGWKRLRWYLNRGTQMTEPRPSENGREVPDDETEAICQAFALVPRQMRFGFWHCIWSYESYYWFRKR